jgi:hypothetical protein
VLLAALSIYGAFLGADGARKFFNSVPASVYWVALTLAIGAGTFVFPRLLRVPGLLLIHAGCVFVLVGGVLGSQAGHNIDRRILTRNRIRAGKMVIFEHTEDNRVIVEDSNEVERLPFSVRLKDFRIEYYEPGQLEIEDVHGRIFKIPAQMGRELALEDGLGKARILRRFENFKIRIDGDKHIAIDSPESVSNPALEVETTDQSGQVSTRYVFERFGGHPRPNDKFLMSYRKPVRQYVSDVEILKDGRVVLARNIEVNRPLRYGGYHFYQHSYGDQSGQYTVLLVASDLGLVWVYAGYAMLCAGVLWHFWIRHMGTSVQRIEVNQITARNK